jgi:hypothetical protein
MSKPQRYGKHKCPHDKVDFKCSIGWVQGRFCKNNCERYKAKDCKRWT